MKNGQQCQNTIGLKNMLCISDFSHWYETKHITRSNMWGRKDIFTHSSGKLCDGESIVVGMGSVYGIKRPVAY